ncbi:O-antigen ligase family protein [Massilia sp. S19_KUP03_FR1]|uniref:O-antigen ligase family protein n=1 Tax=Massilia sp. S19_KUP03_FR1 TaxID=3025503 RepID=UPI002FCDD95B
MPSSPHLVLPRSHLAFPGDGSFITLTVLCALAANFLIAYGHDQQRCIEIVALCVIAMIALVRIARGKMPAVPISVGIPLLAFVALGLASVATALSLRHAVNEWSTLLLLLLLVFAIADELAGNSKRLHGVLRWIGITCALYSLLVMVVYLMALASGFQPDGFVLSVGFSNYRFLNHTQTALMPLIILLCVTVPMTDRWRKAWFVLAAFWWAILFVTEARASVLALAVGCAIAFGLRRAHARPVLAMMTKTALAGIVLYAVIFLLLPLLFGLQPVGSLSNVVARTVANPASDRLLLWKLALDLIAAHPWLGVGPQHFAHEGAKLYAGAHPHNWILQIAAEWGIPALLCALGTIAFAARTLLRTGARVADSDLVNQSTFACLLVTCTAIFADGLLSGVIVMPQSQLAIVLVLGFACAWVRLQIGGVERVAPVPSSLARAIFIALLVAGCYGLLWSAWPDIPARARGDTLTPAELAVNPATQWSRMWLAGFF